MNSTHDTDDTEDLQSLKPPFSAEQLKEDVGNVLMIVARLTRWMFYRSDWDINAPLLKMLGHPGDTGHMDTLGDPEFGWKAGNFRYDMVATTSLAEETEKLYDLAYLGHIDTDTADLCSESGPSWTSRILTDLNKSDFVEESEVREFGPAKESISRCLQVYETAYARLKLEETIDSLDLFMDWGDPYLDGMTIRQLSLLSGMTEASLRTMASPKRKNPLKTQSDGKNTFVTTADAKDWLIAKGRYIPLKHTSRGGRVDPTRRRFGSAYELLTALNQRVRFLLSEPNSDEVCLRLERISPTMLIPGEWAHLQLSEESLDDAVLVKKLGEALGLPGDLLALRAAEARALDRLHTVERQIQNLVS
jgi:hypothetical protein